MLQDLRRSLTYTQHRQVQDKIHALRRPAVGSLYRDEDGKGKDSAGQEEQDSLNQEVRCKGWLYKRGSWLHNSFKRRWFVLRGQSLLYYKSEEAFLGQGAPAGCVDVADIEVEADVGTDDDKGAHVFCFAITHAQDSIAGHHRHSYSQFDRRIVCACVTAEERCSWVHELQQAAVEASSASLTAHGATDHEAGARYGGLPPNSQGFSAEAKAILKAVDKAARVAHEVA